jgi:hypothetical protein
VRIEESSARFGAFNGNYWQMQMRIRATRAQYVAHYKMAMVRKFHAAKKAYMTKGEVNEK